MSTSIIGSKFRRHRFRLISQLVCGLFSFNLMLLMLWMPPLKPLMHSETDSFRKKDNVVSIRKCPSYGCPIYPPELTPQLLNVIKSDSISSNQSRYFPFSTPSMATLTQMGRSHRFNQDRAVVIHPFITKHTSNAEESSFLIGIFDGHGRQGHVVAEYAVRDLPERLAEKLDAAPSNIRDEEIVRILNETFVEVDIYAPPNALKGGCTGSVTLRRGSKLYIANVGDSQTIVVSYNFSHGISIPYMTRKDKATLPEEKARIEGLGGNIHVEPKTNFSRVTVWSVTEREHIGLAMSRSIGDWEW